MTDTSDFAKMERDGWANPSVAKGYADGFDAATVQVAKGLADAVSAAPNTHILDLCTGHGVVARELLARNATVTALDFSPAMIELAKATAPGATCVQGDAMAMDFADKTFDATTIGFGIPHLPDPARGLAEAARVLKPGGRLAFSIWRGKGSNGVFGWFHDAIANHGDASVTLPIGPDAHMFVDTAVAEPELTNAGFHDVALSDEETALWIASPEALFDVFDQGAVRTTALLKRQPAPNREAIRTDLANRALTTSTPYNGGLLVPAPSVIVSATRH